MDIINFVWEVDDQNTKMDWHPVWGSTMHCEIEQNKSMKNTLTDQIHIHSLNLILLY